VPLPFGGGGGEYPEDLVSFEKRRELIKGK
jgi:hypothetical protein